MEQDHRTGPSDWTSGLLTGQDYKLLHATQ